MNLVRSPAIFFLFWGVISRFTEERSWSIFQGNLTPLQSHNCDVMTSKKMKKTNAFLKNQTKHSYWSISEIAEERSGSSQSASLRSPAFL
jgi:hypothetical protein